MAARVAQQRRAGPADG
ncbi:hypothetical protein VTJ04DRAFT_6199 [Mycothermus thermophilus]